MQRLPSACPNLYEGLDCVVVAVGPFAVAEIVWRLQHSAAKRIADVASKAYRAVNVPGR
jgi:TctA family transporter